MICYTYIVQRERTTTIKPKQKGKVNKMKVEQMINDRGNGAVNQFVLTVGNTIAFQSYDSTIAVVDRDAKTVTIFPDWNYSKTTGKHRNIFFRDYANIPDLASADGIRKALKNGLCNGWSIRMSNGETELA